MTGGAPDSAAFEQLYLATVRDLFGYVRRRGLADAEDLVAEVFVVAWRRRTDLPAPELRRAWLFGIARRLLLADERHRRRQASLLRDLDVHLQATDTAAPAGGGDGSGSAAILAALDRLRPSDREILRLVAWEGLSPVELAVALGVRPPTARVRLHRARRRLAADPALRTLVEVGPPALPASW